MIEELHEYRRMFMGAPSTALSNRDRKISAFFAMLEIINYMIFTKKRKFKLNGFFQNFSSEIKKKKY